MSAEQIRPLPLFSSETRALSRHLIALATWRSIEGRIDDPATTPTTLAPLSTFSLNGVYTGLEPPVLSEFPEDLVDHLLIPLPREFRQGFHDVTGLAATERARGNNVGPSRAGVEEAPETPLVEWSAEA